MSNEAHRLGETKINKVDTICGTNLSDADDMHRYNIHCAKIIIVIITIIIIIIIKNLIAPLLHIIWFDGLYYDPSKL